MTDLLDPKLDARLDALERELAPAGAPADGPARWWLASLLVGAGAVHLAMAPSHLGGSALEGAGFVVAGWVQLGLAAAVVARPSRRALAAVVVTSAALIAVWATSRTAGLPVGAHPGHAESVTVVDGAAVALEGIAVVLGGFLLTGRLRSLARSVRVGTAGALGALALATVAVVSPDARDHAAGSYGEAAAAADHHDEVADDLGFSALSNGHQHERGVEPLTSEEMVALSGQLAVTAQLMAQYPTLADAEAAGWRRAGPFSPGLGVHYQGPFRPNPDGWMDAEDLLAPMLIFDGIEPGSKLAGFMYLAYGVDGEPEGFAGPNDHWHYHEHVCITVDPGGGIDTPFGADLDGVTEQMCTDAGGSWIESTGYMVHLWNVPGYESPDGMFTELNPAITCPDGTYHQVPTEQLGDRDTACLVP